MFHSNIEKVRLKLQDMKTKENGEERYQNKVTCLGSLVNKDLMSQ